MMNKKNKQALLGLGGVAAVGTGAILARKYGAGKAIKNLFKKNRFAESREALKAKGFDVIDTDEIKLDKINLQ